VLGVLHDDGLRRLGLRNNQLIDTEAREYPDTVKWARELHAIDEPGLDGLVWMSRQFNSGRAFVLFGDRVVQDDLIVSPRFDSVPSASGFGLLELVRAAARAGVTLGLPPRA